MMNNKIIYGMVALGAWMLGDLLGSFISYYPPSPLEEIIGVFTVFFIVRYLAHKITDEWGLPQWLDYKPFNCELCLTFWSLITIYTTIWLSFSCLYVGIGGIILASMNALAMWIDQKQRTVRIEDLKGDEEYDVEIINQGEEIIINKRQDK